MAATQIYAEIVLRVGEKMKNFVLDYFSKLLNSSIDADSIIKLSSAQSARAYTWLKSNSFDFDAQILRQSFTINQLIELEDNSVPPSFLGLSETEKFLPESLYMGEAPSSIGIDIQSIAELFPMGLVADPKSDPELLGIYTLKELSYAQSRNNPIQTLTGLFAAKEAILKCRYGEGRLVDLEVLPDESGRPTFNGFLISISHSKDYAIAIAVARLSKKDDLKYEKDFEKPLSSSGGVGDIVISKIRLVFDLTILCLVLFLTIIEAMRWL